MSFFFGDDNTTRGSKETINQEDGPEGQFTQITEIQPLDPTLLEDDRRSKAVSFKWRY